MASCLPRRCWGAGRPSCAPFASPARRATTLVQRTSLQQVLTQVSAKPCTAAELSSALSLSSPAAFRLANAFASSRSLEEMIKMVVQLRDVLGADVEEAGLLLAKESRIAGLPLQQVQQSFNVVCEVARLPKSEAGRLCTYAPTVLCSSPDDLRAQCQALMGLGLDANLLSELVAKQPAILVSPVAMVASSLDRVAAALSLSRREAAEMCVVFPAVTTENPAQLQRRVEGLCLLFGCGVAELVAMAKVFPPLLVTSLDVTTAKVETLSETLSVSVANTTALLRARPHLLTVPAEQLKAQLDKLATYFGQSQGMARGECVAYVAAHPELLGL